MIKVCRHTEIASPCHALQLIICFLLLCLGLHATLQIEVLVSAPALAKPILLERWNLHYEPNDMNLPSTNSKKAVSDFVLCCVVLLVCGV